MYFSSTDLVNCIQKNPSEIGTLVGYILLTSFYNYFTVSTTILSVPASSKTIHLQTPPVATFYHNYQN